MKIRKFNQADMDQYLELLIKTNPWDSKKTLKKILLKKNLNNCIIIEKERIIGGIIFQIFKNCVHIDWLDIDPKYQQLGLGTKLIQSIKDIARNNKINKLSTQVAQINKIGNDFFIKNGFCFKKTVKNGIVSKINANEYELII